MADRKVFRRLISHVRPYRGRVAAAMAFAVAYAVFSGASIGMILPIFDDVLSGGGASDASLPEVFAAELGPPLDDLGRALSGADAGAVLTAAAGLGSAARRALHSSPPQEALALVIVMIALLILLKNVCAVLQTFFLARVEQGMLRDLRATLYGRILSLDMEYFARSRSGELMSRMTADVDRLKGAVTETLVNIPKQVILLTVFLSIALMSSWRLTLVTLAVLPPSALVVSALGGRLRRKSHRAQEKMADFASILQETTLGIRVVKAFSMEGFERGRFERALAGHAKYETQLQRLRSLVGPLTEIIGVAASGLVFWYGGNSVLQGTGMTQGQFFVFLGAALSMMDPLNDINKALTRIQGGLASGDRVFSILDERPSIRGGGRRPAGFSDRIVFEGVSFAYGREEVLHDIDLEIARGEVVALVGPSGAGKSTLADLLPRFIDPTSGRVTLDGVDLREIDLSSLRAMTGVVTQETVLFNDTIRNNIAYGRGDIPAGEVAAAAGAANILDFVRSLPEGFETVIGERGMTLSGGQRQRLAIARAILKNPAILLLDEATSSLDTESERLVQQAVESLVRGRTALIIAHRLSTIRHADRILFLEGGRIVESGTHDELMKLGGRYGRLHDLQFRDRP